MSRLEPVLSLSRDSWTYSEYLEAIQDSNYTHIPRGIREFWIRRRKMRRTCCHAKGRRWQSGSIDRRVAVSSCRGPAGDHGHGSRGQARVRMQFSSTDLPLCLTLTKLTKPPVVAQECGWAFWPRGFCQKGSGCQDGISVADAGASGCPA